MATTISTVPFQFEYDASMFMTIMQGTTAPYQPIEYWNGAVTFSPKDLLLNSPTSVMQPTKLAYMFNMFEHYRFKGVQVRYRPRYTHGSELFGRAFANNANLPTLPVANKQAYDAIMCSHAGQS